MVIVTGSGKVTSVMPYKTPVSVLVLIHTSDLQVLLLERVDKLGFWQSVTGSLEGEEKAPAPEFVLQ